MPFLANLLLFIHTLRRAGLTIAVEQSIEASRALTLIDIGDREQVYWALRALLVKRKEESAIFTSIFNRFWRVATPLPPGQKAPQAPRHAPPQAQRATIVTLMAQRAKASDEEMAVGDKRGTGSDSELLQHKAFGQMTGEELAAIQRLISTMRWQVGLRQTRRYTADPRGAKLHLRRLLRNAGKQGGLPLTLAWQRQKVKRRPLIVLADISGSMELYSRLLLQFTFALTQSLRSYGGGNVESFVFGTRLTRLTPALKVRNVDVAIQNAANEVRDWAGGTRIGDCLHQFNRQWARRVLRRGAIVIIISDGCDCGAVARLQAAMRFLHHRCHRLIWLNPLAGDVRYQPAVAGMAAALPYVDDFLPLHNLQSLQQLAERLKDLTPRPPLLTRQERG